MIEIDIRGDITLRIDYGAPLSIFVDLSTELFTHHAVNDRCRNGVHER